MAIAKVCGIETEYGILVRSRDRAVDSNPVAASSVLINAYVSAARSGLEGRVGWDFEDETPAHDARGLSYDDAMAPEVESYLVNAVLDNGARYYVDHAHPEISTPECADAMEALVFDRAAEEIVRASMRCAADLVPAGTELLLYKNNSDGKGNSYGCHENFLVAREVPFGRIVSQITPHFVTRQVFAGAGKVGTEFPGMSSGDVPYQLSQRADFFEEEVGLETTLRRPIVNTRDEPHCDPQKYRRLHVIVGDANMSEAATFLKVGTTSIILSMIEDDVLGDDLMLAHPVVAIRQVSHDPTLTCTVLMSDGSRMSALDIQAELYSRACDYARSHGLESVGEEVGTRVLALWGDVLSRLSDDIDSAAHLVDWVAKKRLIDGYASRHGLGAGDPRLRAIDLQYHDMRPDRCLASRVGLETLVEASTVAAAVDNPPASTRAYFRGRCLQKFRRDVVSANWDSVVFDVGHGPLRRIPMMEPLRGSREIVGTLIDECSTAAELIERLTS